jgi:hypothetical protein
MIHYFGKLQNVLKITMEIEMYAIVGHYLQVLKKGKYKVVGKK